MRAALELRYRLISYHYSCAHHMSSTRKLWMRPIVSEFPNDDTARSLTHEWLDGPFLLAAPIVHEAGNYSTYLPRARWFALNSSTCHDGPATLTGASSELEAIPIYVRAPAIVPLAPLVQHTGELPGGALEVQVYSEGGGREGSGGEGGGGEGGGGEAEGAAASFTLIEDDGETMDYALKGALRKTSFAWDPTTATLSWVVRGDAASAPPPMAYTHLFVTLFRRAAPVLSSATLLIGRGGSVVLK